MQTNEKTMPVDVAAETVALAHQFIKAASARDVDALRKIYSDDMLVWMNVTGNVRTAEQHLSTYRANTAMFLELRYENVSIFPFEGGYAQQHEIAAELGDGRTLRFPCCLVVRIRDGLIVRIDEYFDSKVMTDLSPKS